MAEPEIILADEPSDEAPIILDEPQEEAIEVPRDEGVDQEVLDNLPRTLQFMFWDTKIELDKLKYGSPIMAIASKMGMDTTEEISAAMVGMGDMMLDTYHGIKQILGFDEESMRQDQEAMNKLYGSSVGKYAMGGAVAGALAEPLGFLIPASKADKVRKAGTILSKADRAKNIGKATARGSAIGAAFGATGYVDESKGQTRLGNTVFGATVGGSITGAIRGTGTALETRRLTKANKVLDDIELRWAEKIVDDIKPGEVADLMVKEMPGISKDLQKATDVTGRLPNLVTNMDEAIDVVKHGKTFQKQNDLSLVADKVAGIMSTRVKNISEPIFGRMRKYDRNVMQKTHDLMNETKDFMKGISGISGKDKEILDRALFNGHTSIVKDILTRRGGEGLAAEYTKVNKILNNIGDDLVESGRISDKIDNYFPRYVKDKDGLFAAIGKVEKARAEEAIEAAIKKHGSITPLQESDIINKALRGYPIKEGKPGFAKRRGIETIDESLLKYYASPEESMHTYLRNAVTDLEKARFFGKDLKYKDVGGVKELDLDSSVGELVSKEMKKGRIGTTELNELEHLLGVRFGIGEKSPSVITQHTKNIMYSALLGNPISAATQLGDVGVAIYVNGFKNTLKALPRALIGKSKISATDFGLIDNMAEEFATTIWSGKALRGFFKYSGFKNVDKFGKETLLNGALNKYQSLSKSRKGIRKISDKYAKVFGSEYPSLLDDLQRGKVTENVKLLLFNELADVQPISLSEVPEMYLRLPNGRITYMLKTFMLKQMDVLRRDTYQQIKSGHKAIGLANLMKYGMIIGSTNTGSQYVKDWMLGKDVEAKLPADIAENLFKTFGYSEYIANQLKDGKVVEPTMNMVLPPFAMFDKILQMDAKAMQYMPLFGKVWYYWYGGGLEEFEKREEEKERKELLEQ